MKAELTQQITTLEILRVKQKGILDRAALQKQRLVEYKKRQTNIHTLVQNLKQNCEQALKNNSEAKDVDLSEQEVGYVNLLNTVRKFALKKQKDLDVSSATLKEIREDESDIIAKAKLEYGNSFARKQLQLIKEKLEARNASITALKSSVSNMSS